MQSFRKGELKVLIATDITARGIDIPSVELVVNYDLPESTEHYIHRVGRTGRGNEKGQAVSFCSSEEAEILLEIETNLGRPIQRIDISRHQYQDTIDFSATKSNDWKSLLNDAEELPKKRKKKSR